MPVATGPTTTHRLANGLTVLLRPRRTLPLVAFLVAYRVGARNEVPGITGISHWVEHMLFKGTPRYPKGTVDRVIARHGGYWNGFTWLDFTAYFEVLPAEHVDVALDIESDRMVNALFDPAEVEAERTVILSEREGSENEPQFWLDEAVLAAAYQVHPYRQGVIGARCDLLAMTRDDLYRHYRTYYAPGNAVAVAVGDFDPEDMLARVERHFGALPAGPEPPPVRAVEPPQQGERRVVVRRPGPTCYYLAAYHVPEAAHADIPALLVLDAVLSGGKVPFAWQAPGGMGRSSRLYRALVEAELCTRAGSSLQATRDPGLLFVSAALRREVEPARVEEVVDRELRDLAERGPAPDELERAKKQLRAQFAYVGESALNQAVGLAYGWAVAEPGYLDQLPARVEAVTAEDVQRVAAAYLHPDNRTVGWFVPAERGGAGDGRVAAPAGGGLAGVRAWWPRARTGAWPPGLGGGAARAGALTLPGPDTVVRWTLAGGVRLLHHRRPGLPHVALRAEVAAGSRFDPPGREGLAHLVADLVRRGTERRTAEQINLEVDALGMSLSSGAGGDVMQVAVTALREDLARAVDLVADLLRRPTFPEAELRKVKGAVLTAIAEREEDVVGRALRLFGEAVYPPGHPYRHPVEGYAESVQAIVREDLVSFHRRLFRPERTVIAVVGDVDADAVAEELERAFAGWRGEEGEPLPEVPPAAWQPTRLAEGLPGKSQAEIVIGLPALPRPHPDFLPLAVGNLVLGQFGLGGRLGHRVRNELGLAYYVFSQVVDALGPGPWYVRAGVNPANVGRALEAIYAELRRFVREPVTAEELAEARGFLLGSLPLRLERAASLAAALLEIERYGLGLDYFERYRERVEAITPDQVLAVVRRVLDPERCVQVVVGPEGAGTP